MHRFVEQTVVRFRLAGSLTPADARYLRGAIAGRGTPAELHQHGPGGLIYRSPLVRYDVSDGTARMIGLGDGALLLRGLPRYESLRLGSQNREVREQVCTPGRCEVGPTDRPCYYRLTSPYLPLNQENFHRWQQSDLTQRQELLRRIVVGNLLSFAKGVGLNVTERLVAEPSLEPLGWQTLKPGVRLLTFTGMIAVNFRLPEGWGLGKSIARGFGTIAAMQTPTVQTPTVQTSAGQTSAGQTSAGQNPAMRTVPGPLPAALEH